MSGEINHNRRRFVRTVATTVAAARLDMIGSVKARPNEMKPADLPAIAQPPSITRIMWTS